MLIVVGTRCDVTHLEPMAALAEPSCGQHKLYLSDLLLQYLTILFPERGHHREVRKAKTQCCVMIRELDRNLGHLVSSIHQHPSIYPISYHCPAMDACWVTL